MKYFSDIQQDITTKKLIESSLNFENISIDEGILGGLKSLFGKYLEGVSRIFSASAKALGAEKGKKWKAFHDSIMDNKSDMKKALNEKDPQKAIEKINEIADKYKTNEDLDDSTINSFKIMLALEFNTQHSDDENYKKAMTKFIEECKKKGGEETRKDVANLANELKKDESSSNEGTTEQETVSPEEAKDAEKQANKSTNVLGGDSGKVKSVMKAFFPSESLENNLEIIEESAKLPDWIKQDQTISTFRKKYLLTGKKGTPKYEEKEKAKNSFINLISAIDGLMENVNCEAEEKWNFLIALVSNKDFQKLLG